MMRMKLILEKSYQFFGDTTAAIQLTNTYAAILTSRPLVVQAVKKTKTDIRYEDVAGSLSTNVENNTSIITVNVVTAGSITPDPTWLLESEQMDKQKITTIKNAKVFSVVDIARPAGITDEQLAKGVEVTIKVDGMKTGTVVAVLHQKADGSWETLAAKAGDGTVTFTTTSFSTFVGAKKYIA